MGYSQEEWEFCKVWDCRRTLPRTTGPRRDAQPLDPVMVAGAIDIGRLPMLRQRLPAIMRDSTWATVCVEALTGDCLRETLRKARPHQQMCSPEDLWMGSDVGKATNKKFAASLENLKEWGVLRSCHLRSTAAGKGRGYVSFFQVPKSERVDRAIVDCREANKLFVEPFRLLLMEVPELLTFFRFFKKPFSQRRI